MRLIVSLFSKGSLQWGSASVAVSAAAVAEQMGILKPACCLVAAQSLRTSAASGSAPGAAGLSPCLSVCWAVVRGPALKTAEGVAAVGFGGPPVRRVPQGGSPEQVWARNVSVARQGLQL